MAKQEQVAAPEPTPADQAAIGMAGGKAAAEAAAKGETREQVSDAAAAAVKETAQERGFEFTQADAEMFAKELIKQLDAVGAFDQPPEPVQAPAAPATAAVAEEVVAVQGPPVESQPRPPRTFAEKFRGGRR